MKIRTAIISALFAAVCLTVASAQEPPAAAGDQQPAAEPPAPTATQSIDEAWSLLLQFHKSPKASLEQAQTLLERAMELEPDNYLAPLYLSRVLMAIGDELITEKDKKIAMYELGRKMAEKANSLKRTSETEFWIAANQGRIGQVRGVMNSLFMVPDLEKRFKASLSLNPKNALTLAAMAEMELELPWPKGNNEEGLQYARQAREADPRLTYAMEIEAKILVALGRDDEAKIILEKMVNFKNPRYPMDFYTGELQNARRMLQELSK